MRTRSRFRMIAVPLSFVLVLVASDCDGDDALTGFEDRTRREFNQLERLGKPLVSEALLEKRLHDFHNTTSPAGDVENFTDPITDFVTGVAGRDPSVADAIAGILLPDMLIVQTDRPAASAGYLRNLPAFGDGYGGRLLTDDVVDISLMAVFGDLLAAAGVPGANDDVSPGLTSDNVPFDSPGITPDQFPYLAPPNP